MADVSRRARLSKRVVDQALPEAERFIVWDTELKGFGLRVTPQGTRTFIVRYRAGGGRGGAQRQHVLGRFGPLTADDARELAKKALAAATRGDDPQGDRNRLRAEMTVKTLCERYLAEGCATKKATTLYTDRGRIARHVIPLLGDKRISAVTREDVERFMRDVAAGRTAVVEKTGLRGKAVVTGGPGTATRTLGLLGSVFEFAVDRRLRPDNPVRGVKRFKDKSLDRFLSPTELGRLGDALAAAEADGVNLKAIKIIRLLALTGARRSEIAHVRWSEVDHARSCLRLADSKTGAKVIPLGAAALAVLADVERRPGAGYVFPANGDATKPYQGAPKAWAGIRTRAGLGDVRLHDLRHSYASVGLASGQTLPLIGKLLGHADVTTTSRYAHLADDPLKAAADQIANTISGAMARTSGEVVPMRGKA